MRSRRRRLIMGGSAFDPSQISAVSSWFDLSHPSSVITGSGYSSVHDVLNPSSPATQATDARRPPSATSGNGLPIVSVSAHVLSIPVIAARNGTTHWGFWGHFRRTAAGGAFPVRICCRAVSGASSDKLETQSGSGDADNLAFHSLNGAGADSTANVNNASTLDDWDFITYEFAGDNTGDANRCVITVNEVIQTLTFSGAAMPAALTSVTGTLMYLAQSAAAGNPFGGQAGTCFGFLGSKMSGVTQGLLTAPARTQLRSFKRPIGVA